MNSPKEVAAFAVPFTTEELEAGRPRSHQPNLLNPSPVPCCGVQGLWGWCQRCAGQGEGVLPF